MEKIRNLNGKRVCDISPDHKIIEIVHKGCITRITAKGNTLHVENISLNKEA